jgi:hypothetical protein
MNRRRRDRIESRRRASEECVNTRTQAPRLKSEPKSDPGRHLSLRPSPTTYHD